VLTPGDGRDGHVKMIPILEVVVRSTACFRESFSFS
jgi:hypothetical protein